MKHYRIYFLAPNGKFAGPPAEVQAQCDDEVVTRAIQAAQNSHGAEIWCAAKMISQVRPAT